MKFIKVTTKKNEDDFKKLLLSKSSIEVDMVTRVFENIQYVEFINEDGLISMFCSLSDYNLKRLSILFIDLSIDLLNFEDLTDKVLLSEKIKTSYLDNSDDDMSDDIIKLINDFYVNNITLNDILDKINIKGIESINEFDKTILESI